MEEMYLSVLMVIVCWTLPSCAEEEGIGKSVSNASNATLLTLGEYCWNQTCPANQFCNELFICECHKGFKIRDGYCVPCAEEFENCTTTEDCCRRLICIKGICRKGLPNLEFNSLSKICLAIAATTIAMAVLSLLLKCLLRYNSFERFRRGSDTSSVDSYARHLMNHRSPPYNWDEKPPSYEECMNSSPSRLYSEPPPPYVISANVPHTAVTSDRCFESSNTTLANGLTPLNVQALEPVVNSNLSQAQDTKGDKKQEETGHT